MDESHPAPLAVEELEALAGSTGWVFALARRLVGDPHLAEDVVQEAWLQALSAPADVRSTQAWLAGVVRNVARSFGRQGARRRDREERGARTESLDSTAENVARLEQQTLLIQAVLSLDEVHRTAVLMRYVEGRPPREIARRLDVPIATVSSRLTRALLKLRAKLCAAHGGDESRWLAAFAPLLAPPSAQAGPLVPPLPLLIGALLMKHKIATALAVLVLALSAWFVYSDAEPSPLETARAEEGVPALVPPDRGEARDEVAASASGDARPSDRSVVAGPDEPDETPDGPMVSVLVRDGRSGAALEGALVHVLDPTDLQRMSGTASLALRANAPWSYRDALRRVSDGYRTNEEGRTEVPKTERSLHVFAEHAELFLEQTLSNRADEHVLDLFADRPLQVRVVDAAGEPLEGVPVVLGASDGVNVFPVSTARTELTADGGNALARLALWAGLPEGFEEHLVVALDFPLATPVQHRLKLHDWPARAVTLECPPVATVVVRALQEDGRAFRDDSLVSLAVARPGDPLPYVYRPGLLAGGTRDGRARLWPVGLGADLIAAGWRWEDQPPQLVELRGPRVADEVLEIELVVDGRIVRIVGRILEADGAPCAAGGFWLQPEAVEPGPAHVATIPVQTDAEGRFELDYAFYPDRTLAGPCTIYDRTDGSRSTSGTIPELVVGDRVDLGELRLQPPPEAVAGLGVAGRVVDPEGGPLADAHVVWVEERDTGSATYWDSSGFGAPTLADGSFILAGNPPSQAARLRVEPTSGYYHEPVAVEVPAQDVVLRMIAGASLTGRVLLEEGMPAHRLSLSLWNEGQGATPPRSDVYGWQSAVLERGRFEFPGLAPGSYTLRVEASRADLDPLVIEAIRVSGTGLAQDPRLDPVDLTGRYRAIVLRTVDPEGSPVNASVYAFHREETPDGGVRVLGPRYIGHTERGRLLASVALDHALVVQAEGFFAVSLDLAALPEEVVLQRGQTVMLEWTGDRPLDELPYELKLRLVAEDAPEAFGGPRVQRYLDLWSPDETSLADLGAGENRLSVPGPGLYRIVWEADYEVSDGSHLARRVELAEDARILVAGEEDVPVPVSLPAEVLERETAWMRARFEELKAAGSLSPDLAFGDEEPRRR